jgi:DNA helicase-2/ATP-dependent DNA helicase PcrA
LFTSHGTGYPVTLKQMPSAFIEAAYIAEEVKRLIAHSGNMLGHNDFAVLRKLLPL